MIRSFHTLSVVLLASLTALCARADVLAPVDAVDPLIGTAEHGHVFPGATTPMGMVALSPDTRQGTWDGAAGYHYSDSVILGFSHTHLSGTGVGDLGDIRMIPRTGAVRWEPGDAGRPGYRSTFWHREEEARPGYYKVRLSDYDITAELTATPHVGVHRYTFPKDQAGHVLIDLSRAVGGRNVENLITLEDDRTVTGHRIANGWGGRREIYFVMEFSRPISKTQLVSDDNELPADSKLAKAREAKAALFFDNPGTVLVRVGISSVSVENAKKNLVAEAKEVDFDDIVSRSKKAWSEALDRVQIDEPDRARRRTFYTALYRTLIAPTLWSDVDDQYRGADGQVHTATGYKYYTQLSLWDTFRAQHPLLTLTQPEHVNDFVKTMLDHADITNDRMLPVWTNAGRENWCMIGNHAIPVIAEAYAKGFRDYGAKRALNAMVRSVEDDKFDKKLYRDLGGWMPQDLPHGRQAVSKVLEFAYDDACISRFAKALGADEIAEKYAKRGESWRNHLDPETRLMRPKEKDGSWITPFDPTKVGHENFTEANSWQYTFFVPQNVPGMIEAMGGSEFFVKHLDEMFETDAKVDNHLPDVTGLIGQYAHGNEPCHHVAYLYNYAGRADKTQERVRQIATTLYNDSPAGLCGNDDCGQMSAWYVFTAMGFYPVDPASAVYQIGSPLFDSLTLSTSNAEGKKATFKVVAENNSATHLYIQSARLNGKPLARSWITHEEIVAGGELKLVMGDTPSDWGK